MVKIVIQIGNMKSPQAGFSSMGRAGIEPAILGLKVRPDNTQRDAPS
jgi:hypothetical protein